MRSPGRIVVTGQIAAVFLACAAMVTLTGCGGPGARGSPGEAPPGPADLSDVAVVDTPTWSGQVASIVHQNCAACHRSGGSAPFSLLDYQEAASRADRIASAAGRRYMPPWLPDPGIGEFQGERRLGESQIALLRRWAEVGAPDGDPMAAPEPASFPSEWSLGEPDLVVELPEYQVPAEGRDLYRNLVVPVPLAAPRWIRAVEVRPGDPRVVHHARMMVDSTSSSRDLAASEAGPGFDGMHVRSAAGSPDGFFIGWTPGKVPHAGREDLAWHLAPGTDLVLQLHLRPTGAPAPVRARIGFHFAATPPQRMPVLLMLESRDIDIAPGDTAFVVEDRYRLPVPVELLSVYPHAHYVGKRLQGWALLPNGDRRDLVRIDDWDFNFQDEYRYREPVRLPAGSVVTMHYTYDNSSNNPRNPFDPPRRITHGLQSTDEMAEMTFQVLPSDPGDRATLAADLDRFYYEAILDHEAQRNRALGRSLESEGRLDEALEAYRQALLAGDDAEVMASMAGIFLRQGESASAVLAAERAAALTERADPRILGTLARAYAEAGRTEEARDVAAQAAELAARKGLPALADSLTALRRSLRGGSR